MLVSAAPHGSHHHEHGVASASGGAPPPATGDEGLSRRTDDSAGLEGPPAAAGLQHHPHHGQHHAHSLGAHDIRRRSDPALPAGATSAGGPLAGAVHTGLLRHLGLHHHAGNYVARDFDELLASRNHHAEPGHHGHGVPEPEPQPVARGFDKLLALRDLIDELEARSEYEDVLFPRSLELDDALEVRQPQFGTGQHHPGQHHPGQHHHGYPHRFGGGAMGGAAPGTLAGRSFYDFEVDELD